MKKILISILALGLLIFGACASSVVEDTDCDYQMEEDAPLLFVSHLSFADAMAYFPSDLVIARFVGSRELGGRGQLQFEFVVTETLAGDAADTIFVQLQPPPQPASAGGVIDFSWESGWIPKHGVDYLLPLVRPSSPYTDIHGDTFILIFNTFINLDNLLSSTSLEQPLVQVARDFNFEGATRQDIISYMVSLVGPTRYRERVGEIIRSDAMEDIVNGAPYVLVVDINEPNRLFNSQTSRGTLVVDSYYVTIANVIKGEGSVNVGDVIEVRFFAGTVFEGERHIVTVRPGLSDGLFDFVSHNSLFHMSQLNAILYALGLLAVEDVTGPGSGWDEPIPTINVDFIIESDILWDIVDGSPYIVAVEINERVTVSNAFFSLDWMDAHLHRATVTRNIKGGFYVGQEIEVLVLANTVQLGQQHIVALSSTEETSWYALSSGGSLIPMAQLDTVLMFTGQLTTPEDGTGDGSWDDDPIIIYP